MQGFSPRPRAPRIEPLSRTQASAAQLAMLDRLPDYNIFKTLAHHAALHKRWGPLAQFLLNGSSLAARERELIMLRMGWLCQSEYEWAQHARIAKAAAVLTDAEIQRIAAGAEAHGWSAFERTLLSMVDELRYETMIGERTWSLLHTRYSLQQVIEAIYTAAQYQLVSMALNTLGVQLDPELEDRLPRDVPAPPLAGAPQLPRLTTPRVPPLAAAQWTEEQRALIAPQLRNGVAPNLYATLLHHPRLYGPRYAFGGYLQRDSLLPPAARELLILRTAWLIRAEYEWAHHVVFARQAGLSDTQIERIVSGAEAGGWTDEQAAVLQAADELRCEAFIGDATWRRLCEHYDSRQLIDLIFTVGGYTMTGLALNSLGVQVEDATSG